MEKICKNCQYNYLSGEILTLMEKQFVFFMNERLEYVYFINEGYIKMVRYLENGDEKIIGIMGPGDYIALLACLQNKDQYLATAESLTRVIIKRIPVKKILESYQSNEFFRESCLNCAVTRSNQFQNYLVQSASLQSKDKIINTFNSLFEKFGYVYDNQHILELPFSKTVLANLVGIKRETLSRNLAQLQAENIIKFEKNTYILNCVI